MTENAGSQSPAPADKTADDHGGFWGRVRDHKIIQWGVGYLGAALAFAHGQELVGHALHWPELVGRLFILLLIAGLPIAVTLAWYHGHRGLQRVSAGELTIISLLVLIAAVFFTVSLRPEHGPEAAPAPQVTHSADGAREPPDRTAIPGSGETRTVALANSIAVLPFENQSPNSDDAAIFASGIHQQVLNRLAKIKSLTVIARTAVLRYTPGSYSIRDVARDLNVRSVIECTLRFADGNVLITVQLSDANTQAQLYNQSYTRPFENVSELETEIATQIVAELQAELAPSERRALARQSTHSAEAYAQFLLAVAALRTSAGGVNVSAQESAEFHRHLDRALEIDQDFALGYAARAREFAYSIARVVPRASGLSFEDREALAIRNADRALSLDPDNGLAYAALSTVYRMSGRFGEAQLALDKALARSPNDYQVLFDAVVLNFSLGNGPAALEYARQAARINPPEGFLPLGLALVAAGDYAAAAEQFRSHLDYATAPFEYARAELLRGDKASALQGLREQEKQALRPPATIPVMAYFYHLVGAEDDARRLSAMLPAFAEEYAVRPGDWALAALASGNEDAARALLQRSADRGAYVDAAIVVIVRNPFSDPVLERPEFVALRNKLASR